MENTQINIQDRNRLYALFALGEHEIREGGKNFAKTKIQWFVYLRRETIQARLDDIFFMRWQLFYHTPLLQPKFYSITACLSIDGVMREYDGGQRVKGTGEMTEDTIKGAHTDAFRRAASMWGIGAYLQGVPPIWTAAYEERNWDEKTMRAKEAFAQFRTWFLGDTQNATTQGQISTEGAQVLSTPPVKNGGVQTSQDRSMQWAKENGFDISKHPTPQNPQDAVAWEKWRKDVTKGNTK